MQYSVYRSLSNFSILLQLACFILELEKGFEVIKISVIKFQGNYDGF